MSFDDPQVKAAYDEVSTEHSPSNWLVAGYRDSRDSISFYQRGAGGLPELRSYLKSLPDEVLFAYVRFNEDKYALLTVVAAHASGVKRARALVHTRPLGQFFKMRHLQTTIQALGDINEDHLLQRMAVSPSSPVLQQRMQQHRFHSSTGAHQQSSPAMQQQPEGRRGGTTSFLAATICADDHLQQATVKPEDFDALLTDWKKPMTGATADGKKPTPITTTARNMAATAKDDDDSSDQSITTPDGKTPTVDVETTLPTPVDQSTPSKHAFHMRAADMSRERSTAPHAMHNKIHGHLSVLNHKDNTWKRRPYAIVNRQMIFYTALEQPKQVMTVDLSMVRGISRAHLDICVAHSLRVEFQANSLEYAERKGEPMYLYVDDCTGVPKLMTEILRACSG